MKSISQVSRKVRKVCAVVLSGAGVLTAIPAFADDNIPRPELHRMGSQLYAESCLICHGPNGEGDGSLATEFAPGPRDFTLGNFKFRSTGFGESPARADLIWVIRNGIEGSYGRTMPAFDSFSDSEIQALAEVVRQFAGIETYGTPVNIPTRRLVFREASARQIYASAGCGECHGENFDGNGPAAKGLVDEGGSPIAPADFTTGKFKGGVELPQIWLRIYGGVSGTPMPSFGQNLTAEEIWALTMLVSSR